LIDYYRSHGFADVVIESALSMHGPEKRLVTADLNIQEGPLYRIRFEGNAHFSDRRLRKDLVLFKTGNRGNIGLRRSIYQIRRDYMQVGFGDVQVHWHESTLQGPPAVRRVTVAIEEGRRRIVRQITIEGNARIDDGTIRGQMLTRPTGVLNQGAYVPEVLREDLTAIEALYHSRGFLSARVFDHVVVDPRTAKVRIAVTIEEGPRTLVGQVVLKGDLPLAETLLRKGLRLKPGQPYVAFTLKDDEDILASRISPHGYPYVNVQGGAQLSADRTKADIGYTIAPGPHVRVGQIFFVGNFNTRDRFMRRELGFKTGDDFSLKEVLEAQRRLRNLNVFESVQVHSIGLKERQDKVHLLVRTVEKKPYYFLAGGGYQTDKGFYGRTQIGDYNFTGTAKDLSLSAELSQVGYRTDIGIGEPRLFGTSIRADTALFAERSEPFNQDFGTDTFGASITFSHSWKHHISTGLGVRYERREQFIRERTAVTVQTDPSVFEPRSIVVTTPSVLYDSRDSFIHPRRGQWVNTTVDISNGLDNALDDFLKYRVEVRAYHTLFTHMTLAGRAWAGYLEPTGGAQPPLDQLFYLGGTTTVRGFMENMLRFDAEGNPIGGRMALLASLEARIDVGYNFQLVPFVDTGSVREALMDAGSAAFRWSAGLGLEYITPIGPIGLFYGYKLDRRPGESVGAWHLSVGYTF
jgi:outer membrane protein insertion porin family